MSSLEPYGRLMVLGVVGIGLAWPLWASQEQSAPPKSGSIASLSAASSESSSRAGKKGKNKGSEPATSSPASTPAGTVQYSIQAVDNATYRIGVEDELQVSVWREPELSLSVVVRPDGMISVPLLNDVPVVGLTPMQLQTLLGEKLKEFVSQPQVTIIVRGIRSRKVFLVGNVGTQGAFPLNGAKTVLELMAEAGGPGPFAKAGSIYILRTENGRQIRIPFNYKKAITGRTLNNIELQPGDIVVVP